MVRRTVLPILLALWSSVALAAEEGRGFEHLRALFEIAAANGNTRDAGTPGYDASARYVAEQLRTAGFAVRLEEFTFPLFEENAPPVLSLGPTSVSTNAIRTLNHSGSGRTTARITPVALALPTGQAQPGPSTSACQAADFAGFPIGTIALVRRGTCPFLDKVRNAVAAGAAGVIIMNEGTEGRTDLFSGRLSEPVTVPVIGVAYDFGAMLARTVEPIGLHVDAGVIERRTRNVIAETPPGQDAPLVVIGAHLDSVAAGPGINDNGSGVAAVLEAALRIGPDRHPGHRLRFAFWSAEEHGLLGSRHHVARLSDEERQQIGVYINLDMVGSPNPGRFVEHSGDASGHPASTVREALVGWFESRGLGVRQRGRENRRRGFASDDAAFSEKGIPVVGLYTGAGDTMGEDDAALFGGTAGKPYDPCYHKGCDGLDNIDRTALDNMTAALTAAVSLLAARDR